MATSWLLAFPALLVALSGAVGAQEPDVIDDFETGRPEDRWFAYDDDETVTARIRGDRVGAGGRALRFEFETRPGGYPGCGTTFDPPRDLSRGKGLALSMRADVPDVRMAVVLYSEGAPFVAPPIEPREDLSRVVLPWSAFERPEWAEPGGAEVLDPSRVREINLVVGSEERGVSGTIWIDSIELEPPDGGQGERRLRSGDPFALWQGKSRLRGANIWQRVVTPELDGPEFLGTGRVGPPFTAEDFRRLAALGANYVNLSGPGLFTMTPPYVLDPEVEANLDRLLELCLEADLFCVITFRTGPGRSDFTFYRDGAGEWFDPELLIETVWTDRRAQDAWVEMWRHTARRYRDHPAVVGYDLLCEPNAAGLLGIWDPEEFYERHAGSLHDWNQLHPRLAAAVREVDADTPILIGPMGWNSVRWLPYLAPSRVPRTVYVVHQYEPQDAYTHQRPGGTNRYPGRFDADGDRTPDRVDRRWLERYLAPVDRFRERHRAPVAVNEFGVQRWVPGGAAFLSDEIALFEERGMSHAIWNFCPDWPPARENDSFDYLHGPDPDHHAVVKGSDVIDVLRASWAENRDRPSTYGR